jgi:hypothetical protein
MLRDNETPQGAPHTLFSAGRLRNPPSTGPAIGRTRSAQAATNPAQTDNSTVTRKITVKYGTDAANNVGEDFVAKTSASCSMSNSSMDEPALK